ncbi:hypothetical protein SARC_00089 [Sphaeroforma arctica JP610]|uniref:XPG-I domain-containing protein n=1 Tax=Sphaeroforma arctica JP610 TaxID=667725 RepID=A0A0L0GFM6_9EUKA|nr:hypothetical protein SARC_00089 [Sphaeroforma arctica JP610]KNC87832.1 hypothetical protein SARC_00089 [Sphaeroforma arctica JP610]|eukprot:XP_014161734.1 hypothetical protein SARC_00089 [Sphaeroforma arctica JP610]
MGVNGLSRFITTHGLKTPHPLEAFAGTAVAIDTNHLCMRYKRASGRYWKWNVKRIDRLFQENDIKAIYVIDSRHNPDKGAHRAAAAAASESGESGKGKGKGKAKGKPKKARKPKARPAYTFVRTLVGRTRFVVAPAEAEAHCATLQRAGIVDHVMSGDSDIYALGCGSVLNDISCKGDSATVSQVLLPSLLAAAGGLTADQFRDACVLSGTDFDAGLPRTAMVRAIKLVQTHSDINAVLEQYSDTNMVKRILNARKHFDLA